MSLKEYYFQVENFVQRIKQSFDLLEDPQNLIEHRKKVLNWLQAQLNNIHGQREKLNSTGGLQGLLNFAGLNTTQIKKFETSELTLMKLKQIFKGQTIIFQQKDLSEFDVPQDVLESFHFLNHKQFPQVYGIASCPLMKRCFIRSKQAYDRCVTKIILNKMKCVNLGSDATQVSTYQRLLLQHLFDRFFNEDSELCTVLKIEIENRHNDKTIQIFCCIEDLFNKSSAYKTLNCLKMNYNTADLYLQQNEQQVKVDDQSIFHAFMIQLFIAPIQTLVSDYVLVRSKYNSSCFSLKKMHFKEDQKQGIFFYKRQHPSLRNPLSYFNTFINCHEFKIDALKQHRNSKDIYANFYQILNIFFSFLENDFTIKQNQTKTQSLAFNQQIFKILWKIFQQMVLLQNWLDEVINPIKPTVTMSQIKNKLYPILTELNKQSDISYDQYQNYMLNLPIQNYLSLNVSKLNIEKYKDRYISLNSLQPLVLQNSNDIFNQIFAKTLRNYDLRNTNIYESIYFLNFIARNCTDIYLQANIDNVHPSWKAKKLWKQIVQTRNKQLQSLNYITISLDLLSFTFDFDSIQFSDQPFQSIKQEPNENKLLQITKRLSFLLKQKYERKSDKYLSQLLEKSFKYKKYKVVHYLIELGIRINNYQDIFMHEKEASTFISKMERTSQKDKLIKLMQTKDPEMFRRYQWEELINVKLKRQEKDQEETTAVITIGKGRFYVHKKVYAHLTSKNVMNNTLSRKDYMFCNNRLIAKLAIQDSHAYIELTEYPLLRYFYLFFLKHIDKESLLINFCGFFSSQGNLVHMIECIPECFNFEKGLQYQNEQDLKNLIDDDDLSEAIIISMMLMPTNIQLKNIIVSPKQGKAFNGLKKGLFIVDFFDFYQKNGFELNGGNVVLKIKNSLFLFQEMNNSISAKIMKKYSEINVMEIINKVFLKSSEFIKEVNYTRPHNKEAERQLYSLIFQNGYAFSLAERMFKIKSTLQKRIKLKIPIDHLQLLQIIDPQLRFYYQQIIRSSHKLIEREKNLLNDNYTHSFIVNNTLISFFVKPNTISTELDNFPQHYMKFNFQGPSENLKQLHEEADKLTVFTDKITEFKDSNHKTIEYIIRHIDPSNYSKEEREELFDKIQQYSLEYLKKQKYCLPLSVIRISYIDGLKERRLKFSDERLRDLIFQNVSCSEGEFNRLIKKYQNIIKLQLHNVTDLQKIGQLYINSSNSLEIKNLRTLSIISCPNLQTIDIRCEQLQNLTVRNNTALTHIYVHSKMLKNMDCTQCNKLHLQNIGIYIFMKINVLLCKNSCDGDVKRLEDKNYSIYLTRILRYLCNRFEESNTYKLELVITLNKLELLDEKFYRFGNTRMSSNLGSLLNFITKAARETLRITQRQIIEIFLNNNEVDVLSVDELLKVQMQSLTNIVDCLHTTKTRKLFKEIILREIIKNPVLFNDHLRLICSIFQSVKVEKTFAIKLTIFPEIETQYYINLINIINKKPNLQKLQLTLESSLVDFEFFEFLFNLNSDKNKISKLELINCELCINENVHIEQQPNLRELVINTCKVSSLTFVQKFINLNTLEINSCSVANLITPFYLSISKLNQLKSLALVNLKSTIFQNDLQLPLFFKLFKNMSSLEQLDFSGNRFNLQELTIFSQCISSLNLYQLTLQDFYDPQLSSYIQNFLFHERLRIIHIEFKIKQNSQLLQSFLQQLATNKSIIKLKIKTDREIPSQFLEILKNNHKLEQIQSNQPISNWLKNHIASNSQSSHSGIFESEPFEILTSNNYKKEDFYRVGLSLDGGGMRGLLLATELDYISKHVKQPLHKIFDCVGGTSIGGILALASTATLDGLHSVCNTRDLMDIFEVYGNQIFKKSQMKQLANLFDTKYDVTSFQNVLNSYFKDSKLSDTLRETNVVITAVNRLTNEDMIFRSINAIFDRNKDFYMRDIARATSAAPTYFPSAEIKNINASEKYSLIDGGVGLNNPSKLVIDDIVKIAHNQSAKNNYFLLSLGTGRLRNEVIPQNAGIVNLAPIIDSFTDAANFFIEKDLSQNYKGHFLRLSPLINSNRKDAQLDNTSPQILKIYKQTAEAAAEEQFSNKIAYGKFKNQSFIEWLAENTARKYDF